MKLYMRWMLRQLLIHADFWSMLFISTASPVTHKLVMENVSSRLIAAKGLVDAIGIIVITALFNRFGDRIYKHFVAIAMCENVAYTLMLVGVITRTISITTYYVIESIAWILLTKNLICCCNRIRRFIYESEEREKFDNNRHIAMSAATIIGNSVALFVIPEWAAWMLMSLGIICGNLFSVLAYKQARRIEG